MRARTAAPLVPRMAEVLANIRRANRPPFYRMTVDEARRAYVLAGEILEVPRAPLARVEDFTLPADDGTPLPARLYAASHEALPVLLYLHGGGFTIGNLETHDSLCRQLALRSGAAVVALEYRLAPEHRFPTAVHDAFAGLRALAGAAGRARGLDGTRLGVGGDSAGGTLAAVCAILARDAGLPLALQVLVTPGTAAAPTAESHRTYASGYLLEADGIEWFFEKYATPAERRDWRFAPLEADDVAGVAPACVLLAECDPLVDEGLAYADKLRLAGVPVTLDLVCGVTHDFIKLGRVLNEAHAAQAFVAEQMRLALFHR